MYASELNSIVHNSKNPHAPKCYCSLNGGLESIGQDKDLPGFLSEKSFDHL